MTGGYFAERDCGEGIFSGGPRKKPVVVDDPVDVVEDRVLDHRLDRLFMILWFIMTIVASIIIFFFVRPTARRP
jgi:hypothetical protein